MKQKLSLPILICFSLVLLFSCQKETNTLKDLPGNAGTKTSNKSPGSNSPGLAAKYPSDLSLTPLVNNGDGTWTGNFGGLRVRFSDFMYEIFYDANENPLNPKPGDAVWPQSIGPEPGVTTNEQFACLTWITSPNSPDNQFTVQNHCTYQGTYYSPGAGMNSYWTALETNWNNYQTQLDQYNATIQQGGSATPPTVPSSPLITPYLLQDYQNAGSAMISSARFAIYSYNPTDGIVFGIDAR